MEKDTERKAIIYYGKKTYYLNPLLARKKPIVKNKPNYQDGESVRKIGVMYSDD